MAFPFITYLQAGLSVIPVQLPRKTPLFPWQEFRRKRVLPHIAQQWRYDAGAIITGAVSDNVLCIDIDCKNDPTGTIYTRFTQALSEAEPALLHKAVIQTTYNGGMHLIYKSAVPVGNVKLAGTREKQVIIETRGEGGYFVASPSRGYKLQQGDFCHIYTLTEFEQKMLFEIARSFDENTPHKKIIPAAEKTVQKHSPFFTITEENLRIGDIYDAEISANDVAALLEVWGWTIGKQRTDGTIEVTRPGKSAHDGISGTIGYNNSGNKLYVFTSSSVFEPNRLYKPHQVLCFLQFGGDFKAMARYVSSRFAQKKPHKQKISAPRHNSDNTEVEHTNSHSSTEQSEAIKAVKETQSNRRKQLSAVQQWIKAHYTLRYNTLRERTELRAQNGQWFSVDDRDTDTMLVALTELGVQYSKEKLLQLINSEWVENYNPVEEWIATLPAWKSEENPDYIQQLAETVSVAEHQKEFFSKWLKNWLVATMATWSGRGINHTCLVLQGKQGIGKTQWINKLCPEELRQYLYVGALEAEDKDATVAICENLLINLDELESTTKKDVSHLKSLITREKVKVRRVYARFTKEYKRMAVFAASVNMDQVLTDTTGNRRFIIVTAENIEYNHTIPLDNVYAQALTLLEQGHKYWGDVHGNAEITHNAAHYSMSDMVEELLDECCSRPDSDNVFSKAAGEWLTSTQIAQKMAEKLSIGKILHERDIRRLGMILSKQGYQKRMQRGINQFFVIVAKNHEHEQPPPF